MESELKQNLLEEYEKQQNDEQLIMGVTPKLAEMQATDNYERYAEIVKVHAAQERVSSRQALDDSVNLMTEPLVDMTQDDGQQSAYSEYDHYEGEVKRNNFISLLIDEYEAD